LVPPLHVAAAGGAVQAPAGDEQQVRQAVQVAQRRLAHFLLLLQLDEAALGALFTPAANRTPEQAARVALDDALIAEIEAADVVVIGVPMYNFAVPAQLKNWIDAITRVGVTFRYTEKGSEGLLKGKTVYAVLARGGKYRDTPADSQVPYLKTIFSFLGITDLRFVYAEGLNMGEQAAHDALTSAHQQIEEAVAA